jgi:transposase
MSGKRRKYTPEFREQAARLVIETGRPVAHIAAEIGVGEQVLGRWVRLQREAAVAGDTARVLDAVCRGTDTRVRGEDEVADTLGRLHRRPSVTEQSVEGPGHVPAAHAGGRGSCTPRPLCRGVRSSWGEPIPTQGGMNGQG